MKVLIEVRPGEGGADAKLLVRDHMAIYLCHAEKRGLKADIVNDAGS